MEGRGRGRGPDLRPRKHRPGAIRGTAAEAGVRACLENGGTLREASTILNDTNGSSPSLTAISRYGQSLRAEAEQARELESLVSALGRQEEAPAGCAIAAAARKVLLLRALNAIRRLPEEAIDPGVLDRLSLAISRLERSGVMTDGVRLEAKRLEKEYPPPEPPGAVLRRKLESMAAVEEAVQEFMAKGKAEKPRPSAAASSAALRPETPGCASPRGRGRRP